MRYCDPPSEGFWRVGRSPDPLQVGLPLPATDLDDPTVGNRFDSPVGAYKVIYFGSTLKVCYGETLARFRPDPKIVALLDGDEDDHFMHPGEVPRDWRIRRLAVKAQPTRTKVMQHMFPNGAKFIDVEAKETREAIQAGLAPLLASYGCMKLTADVVHGSDRRITRAISQYAYEQHAAGLRYHSRLNPHWECWAVFDRVELEELERRPILNTDGELLDVAKLFGLTIH